MRKSLPIPGFDLGNSPQAFTREMVENKTIQGRTKNEDLAKSQRNVKDQTGGLVNPKSNQGNEAKQSEGKGSKSGEIFVACGPDLYRL